MAVLQGNSGYLEFFFSSVGTVVQVKAEKSLSSLTLEIFQALGSPLETSH